MHMKEFLVKKDLIRSEQREQRQTCDAGLLLEEKGDCLRISIGEEINMKKL